ncbi:hypothetical protein HJC23_001823 [Cyclotella cryptica]|uniref:DUS-like FMN-binding domain-containing protein n=1 Tax=Cyclotella cryptica TaxID=29204 RepID=A0ABD3PJE0_9STRA|eukprot:CCRYP_014517-RA/>CCRYP_014517-RA protein AED:0.12 eAED:0.12 QI:213/-1/1/1/-1/1/1/343/396
MRNTITAMATSLAATTTTTTTTHHEFHIAPMQCYTNQPLRKLTSFLSPTSIKWTEMEKVDDLLPDLEHSLKKRLGGEENETNLILQLGSSNANKLQRCVRVALDHYPKLREINLNCGCPAIATGGAPTYGASLMKDVSLTSQLVESIASTTEINVSVKCRIGVFDTAEDIAPMGEKQYEYLHKYVTAIHDAGANHVILHARPAILSLNPVKNRIVPTLDYGVVHRIASDFKGKVKITINGGINSLIDLKTMQNDDTTNISSHMSGRWCLRRPLDLMEIERSLVDKAMPDVQSAIHHYIEYAVKNQNQFTIGELCLPLYLIVAQLQEDYEQERESNLLSWEEIETLHNIIEDGLLTKLSNGKMKKSNSIKFKKLASSFKPLVGTKVVNKWKRNRAEL